MAKTTESKLAKEMYVNQLRTAKEIAVFLGVQEKTVGNWVAKGNWKAERDTQLSTSNKGRDSLKKVIANLAERRVEIFAERKIYAQIEDKKTLAALDMEAASIADQISKMNATLKHYDQENRITATVYLEVMQDIFNTLRQSDEKLHLKTLDFQESHAQFICQKLA
ncbi:MAG: hypothetical protein IE931_03385 [Sphingobacteriales bacterium]|nr:hypothetical protein [Sphingobacteriales bacterium]